MWTLFGDPIIRILTVNPDYVTSPEYYGLGYDDTFLFNLINISDSFTIDLAPIFTFIFLSFCFFQFCRIVYTIFK